MPGLHERNSPAEGNAPSAGSARANAPNQAYASVAAASNPMALAGTVPNLSLAAGWERGMGIGDRPYPMSIPMHSATSMLTSVPTSTHLAAAAAAALPPPPPPTATGSVAAAALDGGYVGTPGGMTVGMAMQMMASHAMGMAYPGSYHGMPTYTAAPLHHSIPPASSVTSPITAQHISTQHFANHGSLSSPAPPTGLVPLGAVGALAAPPTMAGGVPATAGYAAQPESALDAETNQLLAKTNRAKRAKTARSSPAVLHLARLPHLARTPRFACACGVSTTTPPSPPPLSTPPPPLRPLPVAFTPLLILCFPATERRRFPDVPPRGRDMVSRTP